MSSDEHAQYRENATSPLTSSTSTKIGSAFGEKPPARKRRVGAAVDRPQKGSRKSTGKPSAGGANAQTKTVTNTSRSTKGKGTVNQQPPQNPEASTSKGSTQRVIRRVRAIVEVPIKVEDDEEELEHDLFDDRNGTVPSEKDPKPSTAVKKAARPSRPNNKTLPLYMDRDATPPAPGPLSKRRKSGIARNYDEPDEDAYNHQSQEDANVRHRPPPRRKSIRELRESDFEYHEGEEEEGEETDTDELNLGVRFRFCFFTKI